MLGQWSRLVSSLVPRFEEASLSVAKQGFSGCHMAESSRPTSHQSLSLDRSEISHAAVVAYYVQCRLFNFSPAKHHGSDSSTFTGSNAKPAICVLEPSHVTGALQRHHAAVNYWSSMGNQVEQT